MSKLSAERPIGVFDSGIGGLTVFSELARRMPEENLIYFGDTAHVPYGSKSKDAVTRFSLAIARYLTSKGIKLLVVACNTSSALALPELKKALKIPVVGVIEPGARAAAAATRVGRVAVIGTEATIRSGAYVSALKTQSPGIRARALSCPLFVPLVEEGWWDRRVTLDVAREYLSPLKGSGIDALILGCTHYPLLKRTLTKVMGSRVKLIDSAEQTASETAELLDELKLKRSGGPGWRTFYASDAPDRFLRIARLLGIKAKSVKLHSFDA
ncbi:MAG: glutamate racemase [Elusimicrobia bacterium]|nr:glutamate racemase [Elusimicrobiota bacterium]